MRLILIGCEYTGKTTLSDALMAWGREKGIHHHLDDHFSIPDCQMLKTVEDQQAMLGLPEVIKERYQRFQLAYHVNLINKYEHILLSGFHIEEVIYGPRYYYPSIGIVAEPPRRWETQMPSDTILVHLKAREDVVRSRMQSDPHTYQVVQPDDVVEVLSEFEREYRQSWIARKFELDTSDLGPENLLDVFLEASNPYLNERDLLIRMNT